MSCDVGEVTEISAHSPRFLSLHLCHSLFSSPSVASPLSQLILQLFRRFTYVSAHSPALPLLHLRHSSFSNSSVALPTSQLILKPFRCFTYVTAHSPTLPPLLLRHRLFTYVTWRAACGKIASRNQQCKHHNVIMRNSMQVENILQFIEERRIGLFENVKRRIQ